MSGTELLTVIVSFYYITRMKRVYLNVITFAIALVCCFFLIFLNDTEVCTHNCWTPRQIWELIVFFIMRFAITLEYQVIYVYAT